LFNRVDLVIICCGNFPEMLMRSHLLIVLTLLVSSACSNVPESMPPSAPPASHLGTWYWIATTSADGAQTITQPQRYQIEFAEDGRFGVQADCNGGGSQYSISAGQLQIGPIGLSKRACPDDSQDRVFVRQLAAVDKMQVSEQWLQLELSGDIEVMHFARDPQAKGPLRK